MSDTTLFTIAEARAFDKAQLGNATTYPDVTITAKEVEIREWLELVCGVNFIPTTHTSEVHDGDGTASLILDWPRVTSVTSITVDGVAYAAADIITTDYSAGLAIDRYGLTRRSGMFAAGSSNVAVTYVAGHAAVPALIKRAALRTACLELPSSNVPFSAESYDAGGVDVSYAQGDGFRGSWSRDADVRKAILMYSISLPGVA